MARSSTTFGPGNKGGGRKGYEFEAAQLKKMQEILNRALIMTENIQLGKAGFKEAMAYENSLKMVSKIFDKLHANKEHMEHDFGDMPFEQIIIGKLVKSKELKELKELNGESN